jgi:hypothetical protein
VRERETNSRLISVERNLLGETIRIGTPKRRQQVTAELKDYSWQAHDHQIVFEALCRLASYAGEGFEQRLKAEATRMGFPDIDWTRYFTAAEQAPLAENESNQAVDSLIHELKSSMAQNR